MITFLTAHAEKDHCVGGDEASDGSAEGAVDVD